MLKPIGIDPSLTESNKNTSQARLEKACSEFESIFLIYILKSMGETLDEDGFLGNSNESKIIKSMFDENLARGIARAGGMGLGQLVFEQFKE